MKTVQLINYFCVFSMLDTDEDRQYDVLKVGEDRISRLVLKTKKIIVIKKFSTIWNVWSFLFFSFLLFFCIEIAFLFWRFLLGFVYSLEELSYQIDHCMRRLDDGGKPIPFTLTVYFIYFNSFFSNFNNYVSWFFWNVETNSGKLLSVADRRFGGNT